MNLVYVERPSENPQGPRLVLLHGYGADENDLMGLSQFMPPEWWIRSYRAPFSGPYGGAAWFSLAPKAAGLEADMNEAKVSLAKVIAAIDEWNSESPPSAWVLAGFSQGAMMSLAAANDLKPTGLLLLSGMILPIADPDSKLPTTLIQHGDQDPVLPVELGRELHEWVEPRAEQCMYLEYPMGHEISQNSLVHALGWLKEVLDPK